MWSAGRSTDVDAQLIREFSHRTGIKVSLVPASESSSQRLRQEQSLLAQRTAAVDVLQIDTVWLGQLREYLEDLRQALEDRVSAELPGTIENATTPGGQIVGAPFTVGYGLLFYRTDLLRRYGFTRPPSTWDELERQARVIQNGERTTGNSDFWGYVWEGAEYEGLTCNAVEWQSAQGGGSFVDEEGHPNLTSTAAIRAFARAANWVGTISPPGVTAYVEEDARNVWQSGNAAFMRNWAYVYPLAMRDSHVADHFAVSPMPTEADPHTSVLGGWYLGIPRSSQHRKEAAEFVRFMTSTPVEIRRARQGGFWPTLKGAYEDPALTEGKSPFRVWSQVAPHVLRRPATVLGPLYSCASEAYAHGIHEILLRSKTPAAGAQQTQELLAQLLSTKRGLHGQQCP